MSEQIYYRIEVTTDRNDDIPSMREAVDDFIDTVALDIEDLSIGEYRIAVSGEGWRGGGRSCEDLVRGSFGQLVADKPQIKIECFFTYLEQAPSEVFTLYTRQGKPVETSTMPT